LLKKIVFSNTLARYTGLSFCRSTV